ncbi:hypothetical protein HK096_004254 [Nowakowskiella sp. JEL0078]|nr:hypothetical protein HK096_004254 [Nowakowskiella sp. JEL0078]
MTTIPRFRLPSTDFVLDASSSSSLQAWHVFMGTVTDLWTDDRNIGPSIATLEQIVGRLVLDSEAWLTFWMGLGSECGGDSWTEGGERLCVWVADLVGVVREFLDESVFEEWVQVVVRLLVLRGGSSFSKAFVGLALRMKSSVMLQVVMRSGGCRNILDTLTTNVTMNELWLLVIEDLIACACDGDSYFRMLMNRSK